MPIVNRCPIHKGPPPDMYLKKLVFEKGCMSYPFTPKRICFRSTMTVLLKTLHFVRCSLGRITSFLKYAAGVLGYNFSYIYSPTDTFALYENKEMLYDCQMRQLNTRDQRTRM